MRTIAEFLRSGISSVEDLQEALQIALKLEFSTIPPYLCAQWSIKDDPDRVEGILHRIVSQEMNHFAFVGNLLTALGGLPRIANSAFVPVYPAKMLPGGIEQKLEVGLQPLSRPQLEVFMQIEYPEFPPIAVELNRGPATIGAFYSLISSGLMSLQPTFKPDANAITVPAGPVIRDLEGALEAISLIKREGEGVRGSPEGPAIDGARLAHYYLFKEVFVGRRLVLGRDGWSFTGSAIALPTVHDFSRSSSTPDRALEFRRCLTALLEDLERCWTVGDAPNVAAMFRLKIVGKALIQGGIAPDFTWDPGSP